MARKPTNRSPGPSSGAAKVIRCAVYTRKSTEEGLEQAFNSLDAQREACDAYILSQRHEGWTLVRDSYDDGGFSGGSMERPGLKRLLADVESGRVDVIVVYKVDRLTRALSDFAKIVDVLDARGASFVSVTQAFNTTTSMGRLTLNVLLSFAQFEREVTGERIRDKIAASKKKGMWMGGPVPLGYDVVDRKLIVNEADAATVRHIMQRYVALGSGRALLEELRQDGIRTKQRPQAGKPDRGGVPFARGALFHLLGNRVYRGDIVHKGVAYAGEHPAIIHDELWRQVQKTIQRNAVARDDQPNRSSYSLLIGILRDAHDRPMSPTHASKGSKRYRYYVTPASELHASSPPPARVPAHDVETIVVMRIKALLASRNQLRQLLQPIDSSAAALQAALAHAAQLQAKLDVAEQRRTVGSAILKRVQLLEREIVIEVDRAALAKLLGLHAPVDLPVLTLSAPAARVRSGKEIKLVLSGNDAPITRNEPLVSLIAEAHAFRDIVFSSPDETVDQIAKRLGRCRSRSAKLLRLSFLAPEIVSDIMAGEPMSFGVRQLLQQALPSRWDEQQSLLGLA